MTEMEQTPPRQTGTKKMAAIAIVAVLVIGIAVTAFALIGKSPKEKYFLAEKHSTDFLIDELNRRYEPETKWAEEVRNKPSKAGYDLSVNYDSAGNPADQQLAMINNSGLKVDTETDYKNKIAKADLTVNFGGLEIGGLRFGVTEHELTAKLPFVKDTLLIKDKDLPKLLAEMDSSIDPKSVDFDFSQFFDNSLAEENLEYIKEEYGKMIYDEVPDKAFEATDEKVKIGGSDISTEKIKMHLTEKETKDIIVNVLEKAKNDKKLRKMIENQFSMQNLGMQAAGPGASADFNKEFTEGIDEAIQNVKDASIPNGISSTIWVADKLIVKRDFSIKAGEHQDDLTQVTVKGTQNLGDDRQTFDYVFSAKSDFEEDKLNAKADFSYKDDKAQDSAEFSADGNKVNYEGNESLKDGKREFERVFSFSEASGKPNSLVWSGTADYEKDGMKSNHSFKVTAPDMGNENIELLLKKDASIVKKVEKPSKENVKDLGKMSISEIEDYFTNDVLPAIGGQFGF